MNKQRSPIRGTNRGLTMLLQRTATRSTMHRKLLHFAVRVAAAEQQALARVGVKWCEHLRSLEKSSKRGFAEAF